MKKAGNLISQIISQVFPSGAPENLLEPVVQGQKSPIRQVFDEAFSDIAKWVDCEQIKNVNIAEFCTTNFKMGMTILKAPRGRVTRVFTVENADYSSPIYYHRVDWPDPLKAAEASRHVKSSATASLPLGLLPADKSTDRMIGRAHRGIWAIHDGNIYVWPWIQSYEFVVVEWDGIKTEWHDFDVVTESQEYKVAVTDYFIYRYNYYYGPKQKSEDAQVEYDKHRADLMWQCRKETLRLASDLDLGYLDRRCPGFFGPPLWRFQISNGGGSQTGPTFLNATNNTYYSLSLTGVIGSEVINITPLSQAPAGGVTATCLFNSDSSAYYQAVVQGNTGSEVLAILPSTSTQVTPVILQNTTNGRQYNLFVNGPTGEEYFSVQIIPLS